MFTKNLLRIESTVQQEQNIFCANRSRCIRTQNGFTLIEVIVTLILVGILSAVGGMAIVQAVKGYVTTKQNAATTQMCQTAMSRINREIKEMLKVYSAATSTSLPITGVNNCSSATNCDRTIGLHDGAIKIVSGGTDLSNGDILLNNVSSFNITYNTSDTSWAVGNDKDLSSVKVALSVNLPGGPDGNKLSLYDIIAPRNNGNMGGVTPPATIVPPPAGWGINCFVATAAYGDPAHPMVQILRDFRDRQLIHWPGGKWFVKQYYKRGPVVADMIRNRPVAMLAVRCLLAPFVALAFCLMYAPMAIIFLFFVSLIITLAVFSAFRRGFIFNPDVLRSKGSILIGLIITMVIMAILAAAMLPMFSSSVLNQVYADQGRKSYFLAESGFAFAAFQYREAAAADKDDVLVGLHGKTYELDDAGSFTFRVYPYYFETTSSGSDISMKAYGDIPDELKSLPSGNIRICNENTGTKTCTDHTYSAATGSGSTITFSTVSPATSTTGLIVYPLVYSANSSTTVTEGGNITINSAGAKAFPEYNGTFIMDPTPTDITSGSIFRYQKKIYDGSKYILQNVTLPDPRKNWKDFTAPDTTKIVLDKFLKVSSTGKAPGGLEREVIYNVPVGSTSGGLIKQQYLCTGDNCNDFITTEGAGTYTKSGGAIQVTAVQDPTGDLSLLGTLIRNFLKAILGISTRPGLWGIVGFDWSNTNTNFAQSWMDTQGTLSYDVQVKMKNTLRYFMTGIGFRMRSNSGETDATKDAYAYGVSVIKQRQTRCCTLFHTCDSWDTVSLWGCLGQSQNDDINTDLRPMTYYYKNPDAEWSNILGTHLEARYSDPGIMLWQRNGPDAAKGTFKILAKRKIVSPDDALTTGTGWGLTLNPWVSLMVRVMEGYELKFDGGRNSTFGRHLKAGDWIMNGTKKARIVGTPVMTVDWGTATDSTNGVGTLLLSNVSDTKFADNDDIFLVGGDATRYAQADGAMNATKVNHIMVYYSNDYTTAGTGDEFQANNTRIGNIHYTDQKSAYWPPDDYTDSSTANDYFSLVQWQQSVAAGTDMEVNSWNFEPDKGGWEEWGDEKLHKVKSLGIDIIPAFDGANWTEGTNWHVNDGTCSGQICHPGGLIGSPSSIYPTTAISIDTSKTYDFTINFDSLNGSIASKPYVEWSVGGYSDSYSCPSGLSCTYSKTYTWTPSSTANLNITSKHTASPYLSVISMRPQITAATSASNTLLGNILAGTSVTISFTVSGFSGSGFNVTIGGWNSGNINSNGTYTYSAITTASGDKMVFYDATANDRFVISNISVIPSTSFTSGTLDTSDDGYGHSASFVPALSTSEFYRAVIRTDALTSPAWDGDPEYSDFLDYGGDGLGLITSSSAPNKGATTFYDDFAVQLLTVMGVGFLPPIQQ